MKKLHGLLIAGVVGLALSTGCSQPEKTDGFSQAELKQMVVQFHKDVAAVAPADQLEFIRGYPNLAAIQEEIAAEASVANGAPEGVGSSTHALMQATCDRIWSLMQADFESGNLSRAYFFLDSYIGNCL